MNSLKDKVVLVTGAGGSIGSELCRQILGFRDPKKLIMFDNSELALYNIDRELSSYSDITAPVLGDLTHAVDVRRVLADGVDVVFHTAAYKHVTMCEKNEYAAFRLNVEGTGRLVSLSKNYSVSKFVLISTDKAVRPSCVMGRTKELAERITRGAGYTVIRLGNVRGSSGSVLPLWKEQIAKGEPVTITDPAASRYFISLLPAASRIIEAVEWPADTYVAEMGEPVSLGSEALRLGAKNFKYIGLRPGEKKHEELFVGKPQEFGSPHLFRDAA